MLGDVVDYIQLSLIEIVFWVRLMDAIELAKRGMEFVSMTPEASAAYLKMADDASWGRMKERLEKMGGDNDYDELRKLYFGE